MDAEVQSLLLIKTKPEVASIIKSHCIHSNNDKLTFLLDYLLSPSKEVDEEEGINWLNWIVAGGTSPEEFASTVRLYDKPESCGLVWKQDFIAYRCRTCGISPCMSLCTECFHHGNHEGHDFIIFRSETGGACDCGETNVIKESGCCSLHGPHRAHTHHVSPRTRTESTPTSDHSAPADLLCVASEMMPRLFHRLIVSMAEENRKRKANPIKTRPVIPCKHSVENNNEIVSSVLAKGHKFIKMLQEFSDMGVAMRQVMIHALTKSHTYIPTLELHNNHEEPGFKTFLDELVYWTIKFEFPEDLICLLLSMRSDFSYKEEFTRAFILHYKLISEAILNSMSPEKLCKHVAAVSVQLFSIEQLAVRMVEETNLLSLLVTSLEEMISYAIPSFSKWIIDCDHNIMKNNYYWPIKSDLKEVLSHYPVAVKFFKDEELVARWFRFLSYFQGMNPVDFIEHGKPHLEQETETHIGAFTAELEISATPMWTLLSHLKDQNTGKMTESVVRHCIINLLQWSEARAIRQGQVSFHLPLHRNLSMFIKQGVLRQGIPLEHLLALNHDQLSVIVQQLVHLQSSFYQIHGRMWPRNGTEILNQAESYVNSLCCNSMIDADIFLLQVIAGCIPPNDFVLLVFQEFQVYQSLGVGVSQMGQTEEQLMLESCLLFLATLASSRVNCGLSDEQLMALDLSTLLCKGDKLHSELMELLPERCGTESVLNNFDRVLNDIADFVAPHHLQQGRYIPKPIVWDAYYDPIHTLLRSASRAEFQASMDRYQDFIRRTNRSTSTTSSLWPPFRLPSSDTGLVPNPTRLLQCNLVLEVIFIVLYKAVHMKTVSNFTISLAVYLLEMAVNITEPKPPNIGLEQKSLGIYAKDDMSMNLVQEVNACSLFGGMAIANEDSILSLLLQLHKELKEHSGGSSFPEGRVGDGSHFIGMLLNKLNDTFPTVRTVLASRSLQLQVNQLSVKTEKEERRKRAEKRKLQLMTEMAISRQQFLKMNEDAIAHSTKAPVSEMANAIENEYECVICMERGGNKFDNPFGQLVYMTPSSILSHRIAKDFYGPLGACDTPFKLYWKKLKEACSLHFETSSILLSFPVDCGNGVSIQTCGHYLHLDCFNAYLNSLQKSKCKSLQGDMVQLSSNRFTCPMCRQFGNSFLPLIQDTLDIDYSEEHDESDESEFFRCLKKRSLLVLSPKQKASVERFLEDVQRIVKYTQSCIQDNASSASLMNAIGAQSIVSVFMHSLDMEFLKTKGHTDVYRSYLPPLYSVLRYSYKSLPGGHTKNISHTWETLLGCSSLTASGKPSHDVPILLKDVNVILSNIVLQLPYGMERKYINLIIHKLLGLRLTQILTQICLHLDYEDMGQAQNHVSQNPAPLNGLLYRILEVLQNLKRLDFLTSETELQLSSPVSSSLLRNSSELERFVGTRIRHFANKLSHLSSSIIRNYATLEFPQGLLAGSIDYPNIISHPGFERSFVSWMNNLLQNKNFPGNLLQHHLMLWDSPRFIELPTEYDKIFQHYRKLTCESCQLVPSEPAVCLVCGTIVCLNSFCCLDKQTRVSEVIQHSNDCGMGTCVFLCVLSSAILVVVGRDACVWGSIFLDNFGEEDLDLRRGRPLFLCKERLQFLQMQWKTLSFHRYELKWFPHENVL